jgi:hypothetical protein
MGATDLKSIQYSGSGSTFAVGQNFDPSAPWPKFNVKSFTRAVNYETGSLRDEIVRTQAEHPPRGGGGQPVVGEQRQVLLVGGTYAWNQPGDTAIPTPAVLGRSWPKAPPSSRTPSTNRFSSGPLPRHAP